MKPLWVVRAVPRSRPAHWLVLFQIGRISPGDRWASVRLCCSPLFPPSQSSVKPQDGEESHIVHTDDFGKPQIRDSGRLVTIRGSGWVMGSKEDGAFPSLPVQGRRKIKRRWGSEGVCTSHLQNTRLWETIGKSTSEFPGKPADKRAHPPSNILYMMQEDFKNIQSAQQPLQANGSRTSRASPR